jgi:hypothetical protein
MTSASLINDRHQPESAQHAGERVRLKLKPKSANPTGFVDGGWWPRSRDLAAELPALAAVLAVRLGRIERVSYQQSDWDHGPRRMVVDGTPVHLDGYRLRPVGTVDVIAATQRVVLLVVPSDTAPEAAHGALVAAGHRGNTDGVADLLTAPNPPDGAAQHGWDSDDTGASRAI